MSASTTPSSKSWSRIRAGAGTVAVGALLFACGNVYADPITIPFSSGFDAGPAATTDRNPPVACTSRPRANAPCPSPGATCEYGTSPDPDCNGSFVCSSSSYGNYWSEQQRRGACLFQCPDDVTTIVEGAPCDLGDGGVTDDAELHCNTPNGVCACTTGPDGAHAHARQWVCAKPTDDCPRTRPLLGSVCIGDHSCDYGACAFKRGARMICEDDVWQIEVLPCK
jgi:hypothetical protein